MKRIKPDYLFDIGGDAVLVESNEITDQQKRLYNYYLMLRRLSGEKEDDRTKRVLKEMVRSLSDADAEKMNEELSCDGKRKDIAETVNELVDAYEGVDFEKEETISLNGNHFTYDPETVDISTLIEKLNRVGERTKGNYWTVEVDADGKVVLKE